MKKLTILPIRIYPALRELGVLAVYLFGSFAEGAHTTQSDIDVGILMRDATMVSHGTSTHTLYQTLYTLFEPILLPYAQEMDIVFLQRASLELQAHVVQQGRVIFETNPSLRLDFEERTMLLYADFAPLRYEFDQAVLAKI